MPFRGASRQAYVQPVARATTATEIPHIILNVLVSLKNATYSNTIGEASIGKKTCLQDEKTIKPNVNAPSILGILYYS